VVTGTTIDTTVRPTIALVGGLTITSIDLIEKMVVVILKTVTLYCSLDSTAENMEQHTIETFIL
jgi:hypothetical protein